MGFENKEFRSFNSIFHNIYVIQTPQPCKTFLQFCNIILILKKPARQEEFQWTNAKINLNRDATKTGTNESSNNIRIKKKKLSNDWFIGPPGGKNLQSTTSRLSQFYGKALTLSKIRFRDLDRISQHNVAQSGCQLILKKQYSEANT